MMLSWIDVLGYAASGLTLATFAQRSMLPMRILALGANVCFIGYGAMGVYLPVLILHLVLLPRGCCSPRRLRADDAPGESSCRGLNRRWADLPIPPSVAEEREREHRAVHSTVGDHAPADHGDQAVDPDAEQKEHRDADPARRRTPIGAVRLLI